MKAQKYLSVRGFFIKDLSVEDLRELERQEYILNKYSEDAEMLRIEMERNPFKDIVAQEEKAPVIINLDEVSAAIGSTRDKGALTEVYLKSGCSYLIEYPFEKFETLLEARAMYEDFIQRKILKILNA